MSIIKEKTQALHDLLEEQPFNQRMFKGELTKTQRRAWLEAQLVVFEHLDPHVRKDLKRSDVIRQDIAALAWTSRSARGSRLPPDGDYTEVIQSADRLEGHIYLNYMGLLFGGQIMARCYPESSRLYQFEDVKRAREYIRENFQHPFENEPWYQEQVSQGFQLHIATAKQLWKTYDLE